MESKVCQIDHEQTSPNNESLLRKCSICKTVKSHSSFVKSKNQKYGIQYTGCLKNGAQSLEGLNYLKS
jgi:hypothetical protein